MMDDDAKLIAETDRIAHEIHELILYERRRGFYYKYINTPTWARKRGAAFAIHGRRCYRCGTTEGSFQVHHLHYRTLGREDPWQDLRVVCLRCHRRAHGFDPDKPDEEPHRPRCKRTGAWWAEPCTGLFEWPSDIRLKAAQIPKYTAARSLN